MGISIPASATSESGSAGAGASRPPSDGADEVIHQPLRLKIMAALNSLPGHEPLDFAQLRGAVQATDGNLGSHLTTLERAGYVQIHKDFLGKRPRTRISISPAGRIAFASHVAFLRGLIDAAAQPP